MRGLVVTLPNITAASTTEADVERADLFPLNPPDNVTKGTR